MITEQEHKTRLKGIADHIYALEAKREIALATQRGDAGEIRAEIQVLEREKDDREAAIRGLRRLKQEGK